MTLGTETTNVLYCNLDALTCILSPAQLSAMTESERSTALQTLLVTAKAAARLADALHMEACRDNGEGGAAAETTEKGAGCCAAKMIEKEVRGAAAKMMAEMGRTCSCNGFGPGITCSLCQPGRG